MKKLQKGFTLIELMIVVAIMAILGAVTAPKFGDQLKKAQDAKGIQVVGTWRSALNLAYSDEGVYPTNFGSTLQGNVDKGTIAKSYTTKMATVTVPPGNLLTGLFVKVGTGSTGNGKTAAFGFDAGSSSTNAAINFTDEGKDTKGTSWSAY